MADRKRLTQLGNIRALCIFLVVLGHSIILYSSAWDLYSTEVTAPVLDLMKKFIDAIQMPLFFSLFLTLNPGRGSFRRNIFPLPRIFIYLRVYRQYIRR